MNAAFCQSIVAIIFPLAICSASECDICGFWTTIDDETGEAKSVVEISISDGKASGRIIRLFPKPGDDPDPLCTKGSDERKNQRIIGMVIVDGLVQDGEKWSGARIFDPEKGKEYTCSIWREGDNLRVRGYKFVFHRTQTWLPAEMSDAETTGKSLGEADRDTTFAYE